MAKSEETLRLENEIYKATQQAGTFGCFEVTIGWWGAERVDYLTYDTKGTWRCYEIKSSVEDFRSPAAKTFVGHYNYFVMPEGVYESAQHEIPAGIGVIIGGTSVVRAKRQELGVDEDVLWNSMIRSLSREYQKSRQSENRQYLSRLHMDIKQEQKRRRYSEQKYRELGNAIMRKYGYGFLKELLNSIGTDNSLDLR